MHGIFSGRPVEGHARQSLRHQILMEAPVASSEEAGADTEPVDTLAAAEASNIVHNIPALEAEAAHRS